MKSLSHKICEWIANNLPNFGEHTIFGPDGTKYLRRIYLTPRRKNSKKPWWPGIFLHHFYRGDQDRSSHNHPWRSSISLILAGGYFEHRYVPNERSWHSRAYFPGQFNKIGQNDFHRVDLIDEKNGVWSLFCAFEAVQDWGFWDTDNDKFIPWYDYLGKDANGLEKD